MTSLWDSHLVLMDSSARKNSSLCTRGDLGILTHSSYAEFSTHKTQITQSILLKKSTPTQLNLHQLGDSPSMRRNNWMLPTSKSYAVFTEKSIGLRPTRDPTLQQEFQSQLATSTRPRLGTFRTPTSLRRQPRPTPALQSFLAQFLSRTSGSYQFPTHPGRIDLMVHRRVDNYT